jgi:hypothetical protein
LGKRSKEVRQKPSVFDKARNELLGQIRHCGVLEATEEQQDAWFKETIQYLAKRYPSVSEEELAELDTIGRRYCQPVISYGSHDSRSRSDSEGTS